jgi:hypothetical protein
MARTGRLDRVVAWIGLVPIALHLFTIARASVHLQWDFRTYLTAAKAALAGIDPYHTANLTRLADRVILPFVYPPIALLPFLPLSSLPLEVAQLIWISLKTVLLIGLVVLWKRQFLPGVSIFPLALVAVFGWGQSAVWDLRTGNVALIEATLVWIAFGAFVRDRRGVFACLIVAAALFKLWPAFLLVLLLVPAGERRGDVRGFLIAGGILAALVWIPTWIGSASAWGSFLANIPPASRLGASSPGALGLATVIAETRGASESITSLVAHGIWCVYIAVLAAVSYPFLRRLWNQRDPVRWVMSVVFLWVLLAPRPMAYGYAVLTPAPLFFSPRPFAGRLGTLLLAIVLSAQGLMQALHQESPNPLVVHSPFILALCIWLLVVNEKAAADTSSPVPAA